jgi:hypothetical protein
MPLYRFTDIIIAHAPMITMQIANTINSPSVISSKSLSPIEGAARHQNLVFVVYVGVLVIGAIATAVFTVLVYRAGSRYQEAIRLDAEARIAKVKSDSQAESNRIESEGQKAIAKVEAGSRERIAKVESEAKERIAKVESDTVTARNETEKLHQQNLATEQLLEAERNTRLELEKSLAPRELAIFGYTDKTRSTDVLEPLKGVNIILESLSDTEPRLMAGMILGVFTQAGLNVVKTGIIPSELATHIREGITVEHFLPLYEPDKPEYNTAVWQQMQAAHTAESFSSFFVSNGIDASTGWTPRGELSANTIRIRVGLKPNPYFDDPAVKAARHSIEMMQVRNRTQPENSSKQILSRAVLHADFPRRENTPKP